MKQLKQAAELGTVECAINKVLAINDEGFDLINNHIILYQCRAAIKAGIEMENFNTEKAVMDKDK